MIFKILFFLNVVEVGIDYLIELFIVLCDLKEVFEFEVCRFLELWFYL